MSRKPDITGTGAFLGKRKKNRACKTAAGSTQNWIDSTNQVNNYESYNGLISNNQTFCPPIIQSQRLYPAVSDPSVCNNTYIGSMPIHCRVEPTMSLPVYATHQPVPVMYNNWQTSPSNTHNYNRSQTKITTSTDSVYSSTKNHSDSQQNQEFMSLPVIDQLVIDDSGSKRRFSDPGLGPGLMKSDASSECSSILTEDHKDHKLLYYLSDQVKTLTESNRKLFKELQDTKLVLSALKQKVSNYEPGCISDIVREIKDAAKVREDALITKVKHLIGQVNLEQSYSSLAFNNSREVEDLRSKLNETRDLLTKKDEEIRNLKINSARMHENDDPNRTKSLDNIHLAPKPPIWKALLSKLYNRKNPDCEWGVLIEEANYEQFYSPNVSHNNSRSTTREINRSIESLAITNTDFVNSTVVEQQHDTDRDIPARNQVLELEQENLQIRRDLQVAVDSRKEVEAKNLSYERQFHLQHRKKSPNETIIIKTGTVINSINSTNPFETNTFVSEEPSSALAAIKNETVPVNPFDSNPAIQVTLSGPVTDL